MSSSQNDDNNFNLDNLDYNMVVLNFLEKERQRIAGELHDTSLQNMSHLIHNIELCSLYIDQDPMKAKLELLGVSKGLKDTINEIRELIFDLRPMSFDDLGLKDTLERMFVVINHEKKIKIISNLDDIYSENQMLLLNIYRIINECVRNAIKHSKCSIIEVILKENNNQFEISIKDNGIGFDVENSYYKDKHYGLITMEERVRLIAGNIKINSKNNEGTSINIIIQKNNDIENI